MKKNIIIAALLQTLLCTCTEVYDPATAGYIRPIISGVCIAALLTIGELLVEAYKQPVKQTVKTVCKIYIEEAVKERNRLEKRGRDAVKAIRAKRVARMLDSINKEFEQHPEVAQHFRGGSQEKIEPLQPQRYTEGFAEVQKTESPEEA